MDKADFIKLESLFYRDPSLLPLLKRIGVEIKCPSCGKLDFEHEGKEFLVGADDTMDKTCRVYYEVQYQCFGHEGNLAPPEYVYSS